MAEYTTLLYTTFYFEGAKNTILVLLVFASFCVIQRV